jgi:hypothetical protein
MFGYPNLSIARDCSPYYSLLPGLPILQGGCMSYDLSQHYERSKYEYLSRWPCGCRLMVSCGHCDGKGYLEEWLTLDAILTFRPVTLMGYRIAGIPSSSRMYSPIRYVSSDGPIVTLINKKCEVKQMTDVRTPAQPASTTRGSEIMRDIFWRASNTYLRAIAPHGSLIDGYR